MPQFKWYGLSADGAPLSSTVFARSVGHVHQMDLPATILVRVVPLRKPFAGIAARRVLFMSHLAELLEGDALVSDGLAVLAQSATDPIIKAWAYDLGIQIQTGLSLAYAVAQWPELSDPQLIAAIELGERTGTLSRSIRGFIWLAEMHNELIRSARRSMALPLFAGACACAVVILFLVTIRPQYQALIASLPAEKSLYVPFGMGSFSLYWIGILGALCASASWLLVRHWRSLRARIPALSAYDEALFLVRFSTLISQRYGLGESLIRAAQTSRSQRIREWGMQAGSVIDSGGAFHLVCHNAPLASETRSLILLGERSGNLAHWSAKAALRARDKALFAAKNAASIMVTIVLLSVGMLIAMVIYALYQPIIVLMQAL